jgi:hypothetical protein
MKRFDLEQSIMQAWGTVDDIDMIYKFIGDDEFFQGMQPKHADKIANLLLGIQQLHELRMNKLWADFEENIKENYSLLEEAKSTNFCKDGYYETQFTRVEVIGPKEREFVSHNLDEVSLFVQDHGRTLKVVYKDGWYL